MSSRRQRRPSLAGDARDRKTSGRSFWRGAVPLLFLQGALLLGPSVFWSESVAAQSDPLSFSRHQMVESQIKKRGVKTPRLLTAMEEVPRHLFVPEQQRERAYDDRPVAIGKDQRLHQAYLSARMIELLELDGSEKVLEIGTGSGYDAALLSRLAREVHTVEIDEDLGRQARKTLRQLGYANVIVHIGDGYRGLPEHAPFDAILLTTAPEELPEPLFDQLKVGGRIVAPIGTLVQRLQVITKSADGRHERSVIPLRIGRMTGEVER